MTLCNFSAYLQYESGIFNVNMYMDMKTEFKIVVYFSLLENEFVHMGQSWLAGANIFPLRLFL